MRHDSRLQVAYILDEEKEKLSEVRRIAFSKMAEKMADME